MEDHLGGRARALDGSIPTRLVSCSIAYAGAGVYTEPIVERRLVIGPNLLGACSCEICNATRAVTTWTPRSGSRATCLRGSGRELASGETPRLDPDVRKRALRGS
jgi:hypothetical protein